MPEVALALYLIFVIVAFGWRSWIQYRRTGDVGFRGFSRSSSLIERAAGTLFAIALAAFAVLPLGGMLELIPPLAALDRYAVHVVGVLLAVAGGGITVLAQLQMGESWRIGVDAAEVTSLVQRGLFAHARNPIYSGMLLAAAGFALLVPSLLAVVAWLVLASAIELQVRWVEEPHLLRTHGERYEEYARRAGRFFPKVGRLA